MSNNYFMCCLIKAFLDVEFLYKAISLSLFKIIDPINLSIILPLFLINLIILVHVALVYRQTINPYDM